MYVRILQRKSRRRSNFQYPLSHSAGDVMQKSPNFLINFSRISRAATFLRIFHPFAKWQDFMAKCDWHRAVSPQVSASDSGIGIAVVRLAALATTNVRFKKSDTTSTLESDRNLLSGPNAPLDSLRVVRLTARGG